MKLQALVDEFIAAREPSGFMLDAPQVLAHAVAAVRFYIGYAEMVDVTVDELDDVNDDTDLTPGEWAIIAPLFRLYVDKQVAVVVESSRGMGVEAIGRSVSEIDTDIRAAEEALPQLAYSMDCWTVGIPD